VTHFSLSVIHVSTEQNAKIVVGLYSYEAKESIDVSFIKGDRMQVLDSNESDWWKVKVRLSHDHVVGDFV
jgi:hypothetical protein